MTLKHAISVPLNLEVLRTAKLVVYDLETEYTQLYATPLSRRQCYLTVSYLQC